ncbi:TetR/AcrR family transcriptional regulator [Streptomyces sp. NPDC059874]|uniref:TetR/AcrR family transcriptional regulator n=1 Tax=Streptomyces sp. NPDC059874 TaxID=3346983 RepID=UPI003656CE1C
MGEATTTPRERYRRQVRAEIKERAWEQIAVAGASAVSLNAIAKHMGLSGAALYRYFTSRDELVTELVRDAYQSLVSTFRAVAARGDGNLPGLAHALRDWALDDPQRYFLVYGTPVPGYHGPADVAVIASEIMEIVLDACAALPVDAPSIPFEANVEAHAKGAAGHLTAPETLHVAVFFWSRLHGVLSMELGGHFTGMGFDPAMLFQAELELLSNRGP